MTFSRVFLRLPEIFSAAGFDLTHIDQTGGDTLFGIANAALVFQAQIAVITGIFQRPETVPEIHQTFAGRTGNVFIVDKDIVFYMHHFHIFSNAAYTYDG